MEDGGLARFGVDGTSSAKFKATRIGGKFNHSHLYSAIAVNQSEKKKISAARPRLYVSAGSLGKGLKMQPPVRLRCR